LKGPKSQSDGSITGIGVGATPVVAPIATECADAVSGENNAGVDAIETALTPFLRLYHVANALHQPPEPN